MDLNGAQAVRLGRRHIDLGRATAPIDAPRVKLIAVLLLNISIYIRL